MTRKSTISTMVKALNPKDVDTKYMGEEPSFETQPETVVRSSTLSRAFNWYNRFYGRKEGKDLLIQYLENNDRKADAKQMHKVPESEVLTTLCWLSRMTLRGLELTEYEQATLQNEINRLLLTVSKPETIFKSGFKSAEETPADKVEKVERLIVPTFRKSCAKKPVKPAVKLRDCLMNTLQLVPSQHTHCAQWTSWPNEM